LQAVAELFERDPERAGADWIECVDDEFLLAARCVDGELAAGANF
jgi:hypothetical protein